jgi:hypothetical protein
MDEERIREGVARMASALRALMGAKLSAAPWTERAFAG